MPLRVMPSRDRKLNRLVKASQIVELPRGRVLFEPSDPAGHVILVRKGHVRLMDTLGGDEKAVSVAGPWELAGEEAVLPEALRRYRAVAGERAAIQLLDGEGVRKVLKTTRRTFQTFLEQLQADLASARKVAVGSGTPVSSRLASVLRDLARRMGDEREDGGLHIPIQITHQTLADLAGAHRSTVTTTLNDWIYRGVLDEASRGIIITRPDDLAAIERQAAAH